MKELLALESNSINAKECSKKLDAALQKGFWVQLLPRFSKKIFIPSSILPSGPGVIIASGGSSSGPHHCLLPINNLSQSAASTRLWLKEQGIESKDCLIFNPLPFHHVSGLMPWWRSRCWEAKHIWLPSTFIKQPINLEESRKWLEINNSHPAIISLVPTQLKRLLEKPSGIKWLQHFSIVWVGGASLSDHLAKIARSHSINLSPCYGATETIAMVTAQSPKEFLAGNNSCGSPLKDIELSINKNGAIKIRSSRLAIYRFKDEQLEKLTDKNGWWHSQDAAEIIHSGTKPKLKIIGRLDTAINSGGETIFPENLEYRLIKQIEYAKLPIKDVIFLPTKDIDWGERISVLFCLKDKAINEDTKAIIQSMKLLTQDWLPAERPLSWHKCPELMRNSAGKWERKKWSNWLQSIK